LAELQRIADSVARSTQRAVAVTDTRGRILAYSSHAGPVDEVRRASILARQTPADSLAWSRKHGIEKAAGPVRVPANAELGMDPRVCAPIRYDDRLLGYLWLVDTDPRLDDDDLTIIGESAFSAASAMHREHLVEALELGRERELLRDLLSGVEGQREQAADELIERELLAPGPLAVLVLRPVHGRQGMTRHETKPRQAVDRALAQVRQTVPRRHALHFVRHDDGLLVLSGGNDPRRFPQLVESTGAALTEALHSALSALRPRWRAVVGVGNVVEDPASIHESYVRARQAADAAGLLESFGPVVRWDQLGVYQTLLSLPVAEITRSSLHPGLVALLDLKDAAMWLETLETYFDLGCDARSAAAQLNVQRGTLYHRLNRIEELAGLDLSRGDDRLAVHLGVKLMRLAGITPAG
jgi:hypothetical protein